jgi:uncharacterized membrane protein HdeD (DUF308 family)
VFVQIRTAPKLFLDLTDQLKQGSCIALVAFVVVLLLQPAAGALVLIWWVGAYALLFGILLVVLAFRMRSLGKRFVSV